MKTETEFSIRYLNNKSNKASSRPIRALPMKVRAKIHQVALDSEDSFREGMGHDTNY